MYYDNTEKCLYGSEEKGMNKFLIFSTDLLDIRLFLVSLYSVRFYKFQPDFKIQGTVLKQFHFYEEFKSLVLEGDLINKKSLIALITD